MSDEKKKIVFITTPEVVKTGTCSFSFMMVAGSEFFYKQISPVAGKWGFIATRTKDADEFAPFVWAKNLRQGLFPGDEGYEQCVGDDGVPRLEAHLFESGEGGGMLLSSGIDFYNGCELDNMQTTLKEFPSCTVLIPRWLFDLAEEAAKSLGFEVTPFHHDKPLTTG